MITRRMVLMCSASGLAAAALPKLSMAAPAAPEFVGLDGWLNVATPLTVAG